MSKQDLFDEIEAERDWLTDVSEQLWENPEVALQEHDSAALLQDALREEGFTVESGVAGIDTAFVARYGDDEPVVGTMGEFDALPGMSQAAKAEREPIAEGAPGHGCGHNLFGTGSLAGAVAVKRAIERGDAEGSVVYLGTPAEEVGAGKVYMIQDGAFDDVDAVVSWHPDWINAPNKGSCLAVDSFSIEFTGETAHAAAAPEAGRSALDGVQLLGTGIEYMREHVADAVRIHYVVTEGGQAANIVPEEAAMEVMVRAPDRDSVETVSDRVRDAAEGAALMSGTDVDVTQTTGMYGVLPNYALADSIRANMDAAEFPLTEEQEAFAAELKETLDDPSYAGVPPERRDAAADSAMFTDPIDAPDEDATGSYSTDSGDVSWTVPLGRFRAATWPAGTPAHSWQAVAAGKDLGTAAMLFAGKVVAGSLYDLLTDEELLAEARAEFEERKGDREYESPLPEDADPYELTDR
ncbi:MULTISPECIES: amidohydrolase [Halolamina]|uniref:Aminobenzoyl-glutamate utilization protein B n=1 Tax=Halolamina pelagica TaxID=699431 RepID=A0A1I5RY43_9EURY|nr:MULTISPECIES: amidohydrolase [Halolamina]NHX35384.1 amidohydrolase [Halolamina sp. R1-12]SFP62926.1 aminobenzoyl-glutamate utilization protein B [Halolamina pelagica]